MPLRLGINIDHVATLRQARYAGAHAGPMAEPDPVAAALVAEAAGARGITAHLREDRRHIQDDDVERLRAAVTTKLNLEMGNTPGILAFALRVHPDDVCLVPENRREITTEGGLDCRGLAAGLRPSVESLNAAGIVVSLFIDPDDEQVRAAADLGAAFIELHTGCYANAAGVKDRLQETRRLVAAAELAAQRGLRVNAGHGLNYENFAGLHAVPHLEEVNIGHAVVARAVAVGLRQAVEEMCLLCEAYPG